MKTIIDYDDDDKIILNDIEYPISLIEKIMRDVDLSDFEMFHCSVCGEYKEIAEKCNEHCHIDFVCKDCCQWCRAEKEIDE